MSQRTDVPYQPVTFVCALCALGCLVAAIYTSGDNGDIESFLHSDPVLPVVVEVVGAVFFLSVAVVVIPFPFLLRCRAWFNAIVLSIQPTLNRAANKVQDVMIEWDVDGETQERNNPGPLPPLGCQRFADAISGDTDKLLCAVLDEINRAPNGTTIAELGPTVRKLVDAWARRAVEVGEKLRVDAAVADLPPLHGPHTSWSRKFRRMKAAEGELAPMADDDGPFNPSAAFVATEPVAFPSDEFETASSS